MRERPAALDEDALHQALGGWGLADVRLTYAPVGFGDYHWVAEADAARRFFVTVVDLAHKDEWGQEPATALGALRAALDTAAALRDQPGCDFVVAPLASTAGQTIRPLDDRYAVSVFPYEEGAAGTFGQRLSEAERGQVVDLLAVLHGSAAPDSAPELPPRLAARDGLERALAESRAPWSGGPFSAPARELVAEAGDALGARLGEFDRLAAEVTRRGARRVVTHGEPHPGNVLRRGDRLFLVDWDTVGLAVPERDLWLVAEGPADLARYARASGHTPDPAALALYGLRWELEDVAVYLEWLRSPHERTPDTELAWSGLSSTVRRLLAS